MKKMNFEKAFKRCQEYDDYLVDNGIDEVVDRLDENVRFIEGLYLTNHFNKRVHDKLLVALTIKTGGYEL